MNRRTLLKWAGFGAVSSAIGSLVGFGCDSSKPQAMSTATTATTDEDAGMKSVVKVKVFNSKGELVGPIEEPKVVKTDAQWLAQLGKTTYEIARAKGTEPSFCGNLLDNHKSGVYTCICCKLPLFSSDSKFNSGTGWPSFFQPIAKENVYTHQDSSFGMVRNEILCTRCDCHLGHVFDDGPAPTNLRFCVNSASMTFTTSDKLASLADPAAA
jgi:methionine-R-sulfoxide reductase